MIILLITLILITLGYCVYLTIKNKKLEEELKYQKSTLYNLNSGLNNLRNHNELIRKNNKRILNDNERLQRDNKQLKQENFIFQLFQQNSVNDASKKVQDYIKKIQNQN